MSLLERAHSGLGILINGPDLSTRAAAKKLGVTGSRVRALIAAGKLRAVKQGHDWAIDPVSLKERIAHPKDKGGRPPRKHYVEHPDPELDRRLFLRRR